MNGLRFFCDHAERLGNLQLPDEDLDSERWSKLPTEWLDKHFKDTQTPRHYCERHHLDDVPNLVEFYEARQERLQKRMGELVDKAWWR